jgi:hypothetical protein
VTSPARSVPPQSHLTSCTPTKSKLYFDSFLIHYRIPSPKSHTHIPSIRSFIQRIRPSPGLKHMFRNKLIFYSEVLLAPYPTPKLEHHTCRLFVAVYSMYSQLPFVAGGRPPNRNPRACHAVLTRDAPNNKEIRPHKLNCIDRVSLLSLTVFSMSKNSCIIGNRENWTHACFNYLSLK